jgi:hypothetical protein
VRCPIVRWVEARLFWGKQEVTKERCATINGLPSPRPLEVEAEPERPRPLPVQRVGRA